MTRPIQNPVKRALKAGKPTSGAWLSLCSALSAEAMADAGFDWLLIDMEHGHGDYQTLLTQLQALSASPTVPFVRVQANDAAVIKRVLDLGACGVMVPWVNSRAECEAAVRACKYPPQGVRGMAGSPRAAGFGRHAADYWARANDEVMVIIQIETLGAVADIDGLLSVPGVDAAFIGPADLSAAMGHVGDPKHAEVQAAIGRVETAARKAGVALATISRAWEDARDLYARGYQMVTLCSDASLVVQGASALVKSFAEIASR